MLHAYALTDGQPQLITETTSQGALARAAWIDLVNATDQERNLVEAATGGSLPSQAEISEIELSSRLATRHGILYMNMPIISMTDHGNTPTGISIGFVLQEDRLITLRFAPSRIFDLYAERLVNRDTSASTPPHVFLGLMEAIVDRQADGLEYVRDELEKISRSIFAMGTATGGGGRKNEDRLLKRILGDLGRLGDLISHIRDTQTSAARIVPYVESRAPWMPTDLHGRLEMLRQDISSVSEFDTHLNDKTQFLLDATLGFINIAQNNVMKVMAIASVVGIPPVLIAGIYGMNFKNMPEYDWAWGYQWGWALIILTTLIPLAVFRWRKWI
ncbi:MAG TPA: magnesium transporter CorA family protein [Rhodopila sp.]|jgi:magnesium transporter|nr:magnesium transporter CorA family protein [Rhodopila sp.]